MAWIDLIEPLALKLPPTKNLRGMFLVCDNYTTWDRVNVIISYKRGNPIN